MLKFVSVLLIVTPWCYVNGGDILIIPAHNVASHTKSIYPVAVGYADDGHNVTILQIVRDNKEISKSKHPNIRDLIIKQDGHEGSPGAPPGLIWSSLITNPLLVIMPWKMTMELCTELLANASTKSELDRAIALKPWDTVIVDDLFCPCGIYVASKLYHRPQKPRPLVISLSTSIFMPESTKIKGAVQPGATFASLQRRFYDPTTFWQRLHSFTQLFLLDTAYTIIDRLPGFLVPKLTDGQRITPDDLRFYSDVNVAMVPEFLDFPTPMTHRLIRTDMDCPSPAKLDEPYLSFVEDANSRGTVLFALGHFCDWTYAPTGAVQAFMDAFASLPEYRFIWQFIGERPKSVPSNVLLEHWIPQPGILAHPKTLLFISHMGYKSLREAICAKVPVAGLPLFAEQNRNAARAEQLGFGRSFDKTALDGRGIQEILRLMLDRGRAGFRRSVERLQDQLDDRLRNPMRLTVRRLRTMTGRIESPLASRLTRPNCCTGRSCWLASTAYDSLLLLVVLLSVPMLAVL